MRSPSAISSISASEADPASARRHREVRAGAAIECGGVGSAMGGHSLRRARLGAYLKKGSYRSIRVGDRVAGGSYAKAKAWSIASRQYAVGSSALRGPERESAHTHRPRNSRFGTKSLRPLQLRVSPEQSEGSSQIASFQLDTLAARKRREFSALNPWDARGL